MGNVFKFADDTKLFQHGYMVDTRGMQEDLDRLVEWADKWQMEFNVSKYKVMHVGKRNRRQSCCMDNIGLKPVEVQKDLGIMITSDLKCSQQCECAYSKANRVMGMIKRAISYKEPKIMLNLYKT